MVKAVGDLVPSVPSVGTGQLTEHLSDEERRAKGPEKRGWSVPTSPLVKKGQ